MPTVRLNARTIGYLKARPDGAREVYRDTVVKGLYLEVHASGVRTFGVWYRVRGTNRAGRLTLGRWQPDVFDLTDARDRARDALHLAHAKEIDPAQKKRADREAATFGDLVESYLSHARSTLRPATLSAWISLLNHDRLGRLRTQRTTDITRADLIRTLEQIRSESVSNGGKGYSANRTLEVVRRVFNWGVERALIPASPCINVKKPTRELPRHRYYTDPELGTIRRALTESIMDDAIRLTLLTGVRIEQALGAAWSELTLPLKEDGTPDIARCVWMIPADRTGNKSGVPWAVPLVAAAVDVLLRRRRLDGESAFVFGVRRRKGGDGRAWRSQDAIYEIRERSGIADFRPHDLRRTLSTWLASRAGGAEPQPVRDAILGHRPPRLEGTYNVHSYEAEKRAALERWAAHVDRLGAIAEVAAAG